MTLQELIREGLKIGLTPHTTLDSIAPILWGGRPASLCFEDQLLIPLYRYEELKANLYNRFGIHIFFLPHLNPSQLFFSLDSSLKGMGQIEDHDYMEEKGALLGYPKCCIDWASTTHRSNNSIEALELKALTEEDKTAPQPIFAYFAFEFYPCHPRCPEAEKTGYTIFQNYRTQPDLADLYYQKILPANKARMYYPETPYPLFISKFNDDLLLTVSEMSVNGSKGQDANGSLCQHHRI